MTLHIAKQFVRLPVCKLTNLEKNWVGYSLVSLNVTSPMITARESSIHIPRSNLLDIVTPHPRKAESGQKRRNFSYLNFRVSLPVLIPYFLLIFFCICKGTHFSSYIVGALNHDYELIFLILINDLIFCRKYL